MITISTATNTAATFHGTFGMTTSKTALYRHWRADGRLLYVGISLSAVNRLQEHKGQSHWFGEIASVTIEWHATRDAALAAEKNAIVGERPAHNKQHSSANGISPAAFPPVVSRWARRNFMSFLQEVLVSGRDDTVADFAHDAVRDPRFPGLSTNGNDVRKYMKKRGACGEALDAAGRAWSEYKVSPHYAHPLRK